MANSSRVVRCPRCRRHVKAYELNNHLRTHKVRGQSKRLRQNRAITSEWVPGDAVMEGDYRKCIVCGVEVKSQNLEKHFSEKHQSFPNMLQWKNPSNNCLICGKVTTDLRGVCQEHIISIPQRFLISNILFPLRKRTAEKLMTLKEEAVSCLFFQMPVQLQLLLGESPETNSPFQHQNFSSNAIEYSYLLLRAFEIYEDLNEEAYKFALASTNKCVFTTRYDSVFINELTSEFEFFLSAFYGMKRFYDVAVDSEGNPKKLFLIPRIDEDIITTTILLHIGYLETIHRSSFGYIHDSTDEYIIDESGASLIFPKKVINEHYDVFCASWSKNLPSCPLPTYGEYEGLRDLLKWVSSPIGFTMNSLWKARFIDNYPSFGFSKDRFFSFIDGLLEDLGTKVKFISHQALNMYRTPFELNGNLLDTGTAFSLAGKNGKAYYLPVLHWFYNKTLPMLIDVARCSDIAGTFFEERLAFVLESLSNNNLRFIYSPVSGMVPVFKQSIKSKKVVDLKWRIIARNVKISIDDPISDKIGKNTEIDLVIYANYHLYLIELKSMNLNSSRVNRDIDKAANQCLKYSCWIKQNEFKDFIQANGLKEDDFRAVRIICCTNGVSNNLEITSETGEKFAVVPQYALFSLLAGVFTVAMREVMPEEILQFRNGALTALPTIEEIGIVDLQGEISKVANGLINRWFSLMTFDRRKNFNEIDLGKAAPLFLSRFYSIIESYLGDTWKWILDKPVQIGADTNWNYYVGTQISDRGVTQICPHCKAAVKYYYSPDENVEAAIQDILRNMQCPFCSRLMEDHSKYPNIVMMMSKFIIDHKRQHDENLQDETIGRK